MELLTQPAGQIKECAAPRCTRLYVDRSHRGSRRWCDMTRCGNRAKAAAHRSRHHA
ncbi:CGNR zinc finger domain-containing protein [Streptomyces sp. NPDC046821]|uniref:CGNR zinc finger domain-containing protein n=1 Tax=Streptomyces sp. NPDC046821 TaxID=3154702 RepID=UPI0033E0275E